MVRLLEGKNAIITGATRGIGKAIAATFAEQGANVAVIYRSSTQEVVNATMEELQQFGTTIRCYQLDTSDFQAAEKTIKEIFNDYQNIDILVNNAGITRDTLILRMQETDWDTVINTNLKSVFNMTKLVLPYFLKQRTGSIINMSSIVGMHGNAGQANYAASKAGIIGFTQSVAQEVGSRNIRCNAIAPGFIDTDMTKAIPEEMKAEYAKKISLRRIGQPKDIANTALFLASDLSAYITGQVIVCDGGLN